MARTLITQTELPCTALAEMAAGRIAPEELRALAAWLDAAGREGWTSDSVAEVADRYGVTGRTARRHRGGLVRAGLLDERLRPGHTAITAAPGQLPAVPLRVVKPTEPAVDPGHDTAITPVTTPPSPRSRHRRVLPPEGTTPRRHNLSEVLSRSELTSRTARAPSPSPPAPEHRNSTTTRPTATRSTHPSRSSIRPRRGPKPLAHQLLDRLPAFRGSPYRWPLLWLLSAALDEGYGPGAIAHTADAVLPAEPLDPTQHRTALDRVLTALRADVLAGACRACGQSPEDGPPVQVCHACHPDDDSPVDPSELARVRAALTLVQ